MQNIEFKAELRDIDAARIQCTVLDARHIGQLRQTDTYFRMPDGRLKKREDCWRAPAVDLLPPRRTHPTETVELHDSLRRAGAHPLGDALTQTVVAGAQGA